MMTTYPPIPDWVPQTVAELYGHEAELTQGSALYQYATSFIPGLLQLPELADLICQTGLRPRSDDLVDAAVRLRIARQVILDRAEVHFEFLIDESVLLRRISTPIMRAQLEHLIWAAARPNVTIRIISGFYPGVGYSYELVHVHDGSLHLYREDITGGQFESNTGLAVDYLGMFGRAWKEALSPDESVALIRGHLAGL